MTEAIYGLPHTKCWGECNVNRHYDNMIDDKRMPSGKGRVCKQCYERMSEEKRDHYWSKNKEDLWWKNKDRFWK